MAKDYDEIVSKPTGVCSGCGRAFEPGEEYVATVREAGELFERQDFCTACRPAGGEEDHAAREANGDAAAEQAEGGLARAADDAPPAEDDAAVLAVWPARAPRPTEKRKLFVDDDVLLNFFRRLDGAEAEHKVNFRFVLALVLMRKKLLVYEGSKKLDDGREVWTMRYKGGDETCRVTDPHMDEPKIAEVSDQLNQILETEL
jgi:hypothetical protein